MWLAGPDPIQQVSVCDLHSSGRRREPPITSYMYLAIGPHDPPIRYYLPLGTKISADAPLPCDDMKLGIHQ